MSALVQALPEQARTARATPALHTLSDSEDVEVRALLHARAMSGRIQVCMTREPRFQTAAEVEGVRHALFVDRDPRNGKVVALGTRSERPVYVGGSPALVGYLGQLRIAPGASGIKRLRAGFDALAASRRADELTFDLTSIVADNLPARRLLERGLTGLPRYESLGLLQSLVLSTRPALLRRRIADCPGLRAATWADLHDIEVLLRVHGREYDFAPVWTARDLEPNGRTRALRIEDWLVIEHSGRIVACGAVWDQRSFKQTRVAGYAPWLAHIRPALNLCLRAVGQPTLPRAPSTLSMGYLSHLAAPDHGTLLRLIRALREQARARGLDQLVLTLADRDPRMASVKATFSARSYPSILYAVHPSGSSSTSTTGCLNVPFLEAATL